MLEGYFISRGGKNVMQNHTKRPSARLMALTLTAALLIGMAATVSAALRYPDIAGHWGEAAIERWSDYDVLHGTDQGLFDPNGDLTVTQLAQILVNAFGYTESYTGELPGYSSSWGEDAVRKAIAAGALTSSEASLPLTRELSAKIIAKAFGIAPVSGASKFADDYAISAGYKPYAAALGRLGFFNGNELGEFAPARAFSRAQIMQVLDNAVTDIVKADKAAQSEKSVIVNKADATLSEGVISGDLIIAQGVGDGDVTLDDVTVQGRLVIFGGGANSIHVKGKSSIPSVVVGKTFGQAARFVVESADAVVGTVTVLAESKATVSTTNGAEIARIEVEPTFEVSDTGEVVAAEVAAATEVTISAKAAAVEIAAENAVLTLSSGAVIDNLTVETKATVTVASGATVAEAVVEASDVTISGAGTVEAVTVTEGAGSGVEIKTPGTTVTVDENAGSVTTDSGTIESGKSSTTTDTPSNPSGGGGGYVGPSYPTSSTKFALTDDTALGFTNSGLNASVQQISAQTYKITLSGQVAAAVWGDNVNDGAFKTNYIGGAAVNADKTGFFGLATLSGFIPTGKATTLVQTNPALEALFTGYSGDNPKTRTSTIPADAAAPSEDCFTYGLWSGAASKIITTIVTHGTDAPYTVTIDYSGVVFNYTPTDDITIATALGVPAGSTVTIPSGKALTVTGTLNVNGTVSVASGATVTFPNNTAVKLTGTGKVIVENGGTLIAYNENAGTFWPEGASAATIVYKSGAKANLSGTQFIGDSGSIVTLSEGTVTQSKKKFTLDTGSEATIVAGKTFRVAPNDELVINGELTVNGTLYAYAGSTITVNGVLDVSTGTLTENDNLVIGNNGHLLQDNT
jgi:hypothetical protein